MDNVQNKNGFSLVEVLVAVIFVGLAIAALLAGNSALTQANSVANELSIAEFLTEQIREYTTVTPYVGLPELNGSYNPPRDANWDTLPDFAAFRQDVTVEYVKADDFTSQAGSDQNFIRVTVKIYYGTRKISQTSWIRAKY